jgi:hypothetical protein
MGQKLPALQQAEEVSSMYQDIFLMAREISLERELLARKNEQLAFLNQLLTKASQTLDPAVILSSCAEDWRCCSTSSRARRLLDRKRRPDRGGTVPARQTCQNTRQAEWINHLLSVATRLGKNEVRGYQVSVLEHSNSNQDNPPELEELITLPLSLGPEPFGALVICSQEAVHPGTGPLAHPRLRRQPPGPGHAQQPGIPQNQGPGRP